MSRREKHASALQSALGVFSNTNTIDVLAAICGGICELNTLSEQTHTQNFRRDDFLKFPRSRLAECYHAPFSKTNLTCSPQHDKENMPTLKSP